MNATTGFLISVHTFKFRYTRAGDMRLKWLPEAFIRHIESNPSFGRWQKGLFMNVAAEVAQRHERHLGSLWPNQRRHIHLFVMRSLRRCEGRKLLQRYGFYIKVQEVKNKLDLPKGFFFLIFIYLYCFFF